MLRICATQMNVFSFRATKFNALSSLDKRKDKSESSKTIKEDSADASNHQEGKSSTAAGQKRKSALDDIMQVTIIQVNTLNCQYIHCM